MGKSSLHYNAIKMFIKTSHLQSRQYLTRKDFDRIFAHYDTDTTGYLDKEEVMALLNDILKYHESSDAHIPVPVLKVSVYFWVHLGKGAWGDRWDTLAPNFRWMKLLNYSI